MSKNNKQHKGVQDGVRLAKLVVAIACLAASAAQASTQNVRVTWNDNPDTNITVGFSTTASGAYLKYGSSTDEASWQVANVTRVGTFGSPVLTSQFVALSQLTPNTAYYMQACDSGGCGQRYWFKTASSTPQDMTFIAGGDSRTNRSVRQQANRMVAKIRPAFIDFGGDLTYSNTATEMVEWLTDWELSYSADTINGVSYKFIPGLIVNVGNHEDNDKQFVCKVFGADMDKNGTCSNRDTYGAFNINGNQLRIYNLNSQLRTSAAEHVAQTDWMKADLAAAGAQAQWRMGAYHVPALPRTSSKPSVTSEMFAWGTHFYDLKMNFIFESDSHLLKVTAPVKPSTSSNDYVEVAGGTVYLGEGAWGAPLRAADRPANWLLDLYMGYNFNILQFVGDQVQVISVLFEGEAGATALSKAARDADPNALPVGLPIRKIGGADAYALSRDVNGRTMKAQATGNQSPVVNAGADQSITLPATANLQGSASDDGLPTGSSLSYAWSKLSGPGTVSFSAANAATGTASFSTTGAYVLRLTVSDGEKTASDDVAISVGSTSGATPLTSGVTVSGINLAQSASKLYSITVPSGKSYLTFKLSGGSGDGDIYAKFGSAPTTSSYSYKSTGSSNSETITIRKPQAGTYYLLLSAYSAVTGTSLTATIK